MSQSSIRQIRNELIRFMPPWMNLESQLLEYFDLTGFTSSIKTDALYIDGTPYDWNTTLGALKTALSIPGTGDYDDCILDLIEEIDGNGKAWIETNTNFILLDAIAETIVDLILFQDQALTEMNAYLATKDFGLPYWEALFESERLKISGVPETDAQYMSRAIATLFAVTTSLLNIESSLKQIGLQPFVLVNTRNDPFQFNKNMWPYSVCLHLNSLDVAHIPLIRSIFQHASAAGIRLLLMCDGTGFGSFFGAYFGDGATEGATGYVPVSEFTPSGSQIPDSLLGYGESYGSFYPG